VEWAAGHAGASDVVIVFWPEQKRRLDELRQSGIPRLIIVSAGASALTVADDREEWVRAPSDLGDILQRVEALRARLAHSPGPKPWLDRDGRLHVGVHAIDLPETEATLAKVFVENFETLIPRVNLARVLPDRARSNPLATYVARLRKRVATVGLSITSVRSSGYVMGYSGSVRGNRG
jgi:DNA-binding response OmpR family regulator